MRTLISLTTVAIAILIFGGFLLLSHNLKLGVDRFRSASKIEVLLKEDASGIAVAAAIQSIPGVASSKLYTKEEALDLFAEREGREVAAGIIEGLGYIPFPAFLEVTLDKARTDPAPAAEAIRKIDGVEDVLYGRETAMRLSRIASTIGILIWIIGGVLSLFLLLIVINNIRLAIHARRAEITVYDLIGASDAWIRMPFLLDGIFTGALGAAIGLGLLYGGYRFIEAGIAYFEFRFLTTEMTVGVAIYAVALGILGAVIATRETVHSTSSSS